MEEKLKQMGLSSYESKCYLCLLKHNTLTAKEIAKYTNIPQTSIHRNLYSLIDKKLVFLSQKNPMKFKAINPEIAISNYVKNKEKQLKLLETNLISELKNINKVQNIKKDDEIIEIVRGRAQTFAISNKIIENSKKEILVIGGGRTQTILKVLPSTKLIKEKNIDYKLILGKNNELNFDLLNEMKNFGVIIKQNNINNIRLIIIDKKELLLIIKDKKIKERLSLHISSEDLAKLFADYFYGMWKKSKLLKFIT